ncbi:neurofibromin-like [Antedon mediterranea]|uniref:neurofibromin-like n=1 Tax=Antedon mediterranea TaxID=105859 RepID=UPI003AF6E02C
MAGNKPTEWVLKVLLKFEEQLPVNASGQPSSVSPDREKTIDCLIAVSKNRFTEVITKLTSILNKLHTNVHILRSGDEKSVYKSQLIVLGTLEKCLSEQSKDWSRIDDTKLVKKLLQEVSHFLKESSENALSCELKQRASKILFSLSQTNFNAMLKRILSRLDDLSAANDETVDLVDIELIQHMNMSIRQLTQLLTEFAIKLKHVRKTAIPILVLSIERAIWNWMDNYSEVFSCLQTHSNTELEEICDRVFDSAETKRKGSVWLLEVMLLILCPVLVGELLSCESTSQLAVNHQKKKFFLENIRRLISTPGSSKQLMEYSVVAAVKLCKAASYVNRSDTSIYFHIVEPHIADLKALLFNVNKPFTRGLLSSDIDLMVECAVACFRIQPDYADHFQACLGPGAPALFHLVLVRSLHTIITQSSLSWWPTISCLQSKAEEIRNLFRECVLKLNPTPGVKQSLRGKILTLNPSRLKSPDELPSNKQLILWLVRLIHADPKFMLQNTGRQGHEMQKSTLELIMNLVTLMCQYHIMPEVSQEAMGALLKLHQPENIELWNREAYVETFWSISYQVLFSVSQKLINQQIMNVIDILKWFSEVLALRNKFLNKFKDHATVSQYIPNMSKAQNVLEVVFLMHLCSSDLETVLVSMSCFGHLCEEADICWGADDYYILQVVPNYNVYADFASESRYNRTAKASLQKKITELLRQIEVATEGNTQAWKEIYERWETMSAKLSTYPKMKTEDNPIIDRSQIRSRKPSHNQVHQDESSQDMIFEWQNMMGCLCALGGVCFKSHRFNSRLGTIVSAPEGIPRKPNVVSNGPATTVDHVSCPTNLFIERMLLLLQCKNDKYGALIQKSVKDSLGQELDPSLYPMLFDQIKDILERRVTSSKGQPVTSDSNTLFVGDLISVLQNILENSTEAANEHLGMVSIETLMVLLIRYVRMVDQGMNQENHLKLKIKLCHLYKSMMNRRDSLTFRQEIKFRNKIVDHLSDWILCISRSHDKPRLRELGEATMEAIASLLVSLPLQTEEGENGTLMEAKSELFQKYLKLFMKFIDDPDEPNHTQMNQRQIASSVALRNHTISAVSNLLSANIECGLTHSIWLGYHSDVQTRAAFLEVLTQLLQQGTEFDTLAETVLSDRFDRLVGLVTMMGNSGELPIAMALANVVPSAQMDELARVFVTLFDAKHLLYQLLWNLFSKEVDLADCMQTLFRGNSLCSKIMAFCFKMYGANYLHTILEPLIMDIQTPGMPPSFEVDPTRLEPGENLQSNQRNLLYVAKKFFDTIISSADRFPSQLRSMAHCLYQVVLHRFPQNAISAIGSAIFLRFINPAIVSPVEHRIVDRKPPPKVQRGLKLVTKMLQNIANHVLFKEQYMLPFNDFLKEKFDEGRQFFMKIASDCKSGGCMSPTVSFITEVNIYSLHRLLWLNQEKMGDFLTSSRDHRAVGRRPFDKLITLLAYLGPPEHGKVTLDTQFSGDLRGLGELMAKRGNSQELEKLRTMKIFYQAGTSMAGNPVFYYIARRYKSGQVDPDHLLCHVMNTLKEFDKRPVEVVIDCTFFGPDNRFKQTQLNRWLMLGERVFNNLWQGYIYNCNTYLRDYIKRHERILSPSLKGNRRLVFVESARKLEEYIDLDQQRLPKSTVSIDEDCTVFNGAQRRYSDSNKDIKVTIKVGQSAIQITSIEKTKLLAHQVLLNDIYQIADVNEIILVENENQFELSLRNEGRSLHFYHSNSNTVADEIQQIKNKYEISKSDMASDHAKIRPTDVPGTLLNMALLNLGSNDPSLRSAAYNLLCTLSASFDLSMEGKLLETSSLCIPANNTLFIVSISTTLAVNESHLTLEFLEECISGFRKSSIEMKHLCLEYMTPWLPNLSRFCKRTDETKRMKLNVILDKLITMTIDEKEMYPSIQAKIWGTIGRVEDILDNVLDSFIKNSATGGLGSPRAEVMAETAVALASANVKLFSAKVIERLCKVLEKTCNAPTPNLEMHLMWNDLAILARYLLMLSFNNRLDVANNLPALFHITTMLASTGPPPLRASIHGLVTNIIHSLCTCSQLEFTGDTIRVLQLSLTELSLPNYYDLFGLDKDKSAAVTAFRSSYKEKPYSPNTGDPMPLPNLEIITDTLLLEILEACMKDIPNCNWLSEWTKLTRKFAFQHNPAIQPRALVVLGCISSTTSNAEIKYLLKIMAQSLEKVHPQEHSNVGLIEAIVIALTRLQPLLPQKSPLHRLLFWIAISVLQLDEVTLYAAGMALLEQNLLQLDQQGVFENECPQEVFLRAREHESLQLYFDHIDRTVALSFKKHFHFAIVGHLLKGFRHPSHTATSRTMRVLNLMLACIAKYRRCDKFEVSKESIAYLIALLPVSEEVRSRCSTKHRHPETIEDDQGPVFSVNPHPPPPYPRPTSPQPTPETSSLFLPRFRPPMPMYPCNPKASPDFGQSRLPNLDVKPKGRILPQPERRISTATDNVLLDEDVLTDYDTRLLLLTVLATLGRNANESEARILFEYLAEASQVFPKVFPIVHNLLGSKIVTALKEFPDGATLSAVQCIIENSVACDDSANQHLANLQSMGFGGLWRFSGHFAHCGQLEEKAELFTKLLRAIISTCIPGEELEPDESNASSLLTMSTNVSLSSSMSSLSMSSLQSPTELDHFDLTASVVGSRFRHVSSPSNERLGRKNQTGGR